MRRTWNSWTYYGPDRETGRDGDDDSVCQEAWKQDQPRRARRGKPAKGGLESAYEQSTAETLERAMDLSDVRNERVARVKRAMAAGRYGVSARELAEKLVQNMLGDYR